MFVLRRIYCRSFQMVFKMALPFLPYRNPKIIPSVAGIPEVCRKKKITKVMIVTDEGIRRLGLTSFLEKTLTENNISLSDNQYDALISLRPIPLSGMWRRPESCI